MKLTDFKVELPMLKKRIDSMSDKELECFIKRLLQRPLKSNRDHQHLYNNLLTNLGGKK